MLLTGLIFGGGLLYWIGLILHQRWITGTGAVGLMLALLVLWEAGGIAVTGILFILSLGLLALALRRTPASPWHAVGWTFFIVLALALGLRVMPFFMPVETIQTTERLFQFSPEKAVLLLLLPPMVLVSWSIQKRQPPPRRSGMVAVLVGVGTLAVVVPIGWLTGFIQPGLATQSPQFLSYWLAYNLIYTCVVEESFFRGILQTAFIRALERRFAGVTAQAVGIFLAALLFGIAHLGGGPVFVLLATIAGVGYGMAYELSGRLHYAVLVHFAVNGVRLLVFDAV